MVRLVVPFSQIIIRDVFDKRIVQGVVVQQITIFAVDDVDAGFLMMASFAIFEADVLHVVDGDYVNFFNFKTQQLSQFWRTGVIRLIHSGTDAANTRTGARLSLS